MSEEIKFKCGFIGLVGAHQLRKIHLLNRLVGEKVSIVSPRAQTTYHGVRGILNQTGRPADFCRYPWLSAAYGGRCAAFEPGRGPELEGV